MNEHPKPHSPCGQRTGLVESDAAGKAVVGLRGRQARGVRPEASGTHYYTRYFRWDQDDRLIRYEAYNEQTSTTEKTVVYTYCRTCGGQRTGRIAYDAAGNVVEWLRYEMEGLNHLRIDEVWDADDDGYLDDPATSGDEWRVQRVYVNGQGQLGQIVKVIVYDYTGGSTTATPYYYGYDVLGNVSVISDNAGDEVDQFEQDAFGNLVSGNWVTRIGNITEQITTKQYDVDLGLYYFSARWYDPVSGAFISVDPIAQHSFAGSGSVCDILHRTSTSGAAGVLFSYLFSHDAPTHYVDVTGLFDAATCQRLEDIARGLGYNVCAQACRNKCTLTNPNAVAPTAGAFFAQCIATCEKDVACIQDLLAYYECVVKSMSSGLTKPQSVAKCVCIIATACR